ncbi:MAG: 16S rRNA (cytosine(1402)-N(4))-methyltransferase RsmH [Alphaproteobacteria bacterium]|jgi:16S rRNA (cytosine1402-N4)-methyltransferase|nr:16S rRNA (cytosine(1402)-N(4))-methyltransferase RsmH [Alphaproteobacteria bacterium]
MNRPAHLPVMLDEVRAALSPVDGGTYVDGTYGNGGYSRAILDAADCRVIAIDRDPDAVAAGQEIVDRYAGRLTLVLGRFSALDDLAADGGAELVQGVALDLGVSSMQLDQAERGFSFAADGPLDMRMSRAGESAADVVNSRSRDELADLIYQFGEERRSRAVARAIVEARAAAPISRTGQLAEIVARAVGRAGRIHPATRTFQALRIYVNREIEELRLALGAAERLLAPRGHLAVVSFHSLEDREVKRFLTERSGGAARGSRHRPPEQDGGPITFELPRRGVNKPSAAEIAANPRARSARLRSARRTEAPAPAREVAA